MVKKKNKNEYEKVIDEIHNAWNDICDHPHKNTRGVDGVSIKSFSSNIQKNIALIRSNLRTGAFHFNKLRPSELSQHGKKREILVCTVQDRIVTRSILRVIQSKFKKYYSGNDYSVRRLEKNQELNGIPLAAKVIQDKIKGNYVWVFETDIKKFFDNIPKDKIMAIIKSQITDTKLTALIQEIINFQVFKEQEDFAITKEYSTDNGIAQGSAISPLLASIYLYEFDKSIQEDKGVELVRYVDDLVILCKTEDKAKEMYQKTREKLKMLGLSIHELNKAADSGKIKTKITKTNNKNFVFLGLNFNHCVIDISADKKKECLESIVDVLHEKDISFLERSRKIEKKLISLIKQYSHAHYSTKASLESICAQADKLLEKHYLDNCKRILGLDPFRKLNDNQIQSFYNFLGINLKQKLLKHNRSGLH